MLYRHIHREALSTKMTKEKGPTRERLVAAGQVDVHRLHWPTGVR